VGATSTNHFMSDRTLAPGPEDSSGPFLVGSSEFVWGAQITPHPECACHGRSFLWDGGRGDCFSPWTTTIRPRCAEMCLCQDVLGSGSGLDMQYDAAAKVCTNGTTASQVEACGVAQRCEDDDSYADSDGDDCLFYASYPNPTVACNHPGYTEALTRCPVACGTCAALGLDPAAQVRKTPSLPRSWANFSLFSLHSHRNAGPNLHRLGLSDTFVAAEPVRAFLRRAARFALPVQGPRRPEDTLGERHDPIRHHRCVWSGSVQISTVFNPNFYSFTVLDLSRDRFRAVRSKTGKLLLSIVHVVEL
jgi:hypothetical protein